MPDTAGAGGTEIAAGAAAGAGAVSPAVTGVAGAPAWNAGVGADRVHHGRHRWALRLQVAAQPAIFSSGW